MSFRYLQGRWLYHCPGQLSANLQNWQGSSWGEVTWLRREATDHVSFQHRIGQLMSDGWENLGVHSFTCDLQPPSSCRARAQGWNTPLPLTRRPAAPWISGPAFWCTSIKIPADGLPCRASSVYSCDWPQCRCTPCSSWREWLPASLWILLTKWLAVSWLS